jgi:hypothetical protein
VWDIQLEYSQVSDKNLPTFKNFGCIILLGVSLFRYRNFRTDLNEVRTRGKVSDGIRHDCKELIVQDENFLPYVQVLSSIPVVSHPGAG